jgi:hypothetical protein
MIRIIKLTLILSLFVQINYAQTQQATVKTIEEWNVLLDSITTRLKIAETGTALYIGKPLSELASFLKENGIEVTQIVVFPNHDDSEVTGVALWFTTLKNTEFALDHRLAQRSVRVSFERSKSFEEALALSRKYQGQYIGGLKDYFSDLIIRDIYIWIPNREGQQLRSIF